MSSQHVISVGGSKYKTTSLCLQIEPIPIKRKPINPPPPLSHIYELLSFLINVFHPPMDQKKEKEESKHFPESVEWIICVCVCVKEIRS